MSTPTPVPAATPTLSTQAQALITDFINEPGVTQDHVDNLQAAINASPALINQINDAVAQGHLRNIAPLTNPNAGGEYNAQQQEMRLPLSRLATPPAGPGQAGQAAANASEITFVLGHELQHGFNRVATAQAYTDFNTSVTAIAQSNAVPRDYTAPIEALITQNRRDEAGAEIAGWNAIVGRVRGGGNATPSLQDIYNANPSRMGDFIDRSGTAPAFAYTLKPNLTINADMTMTATAANVEAMGRNYFDHAPSQARLGALGNSDYANFYGAYAISVIGQVDRHHNPPQPGVTTPQVGLDMARLKLSEQLMEQNGIDIGPSTATLPYYDTGKQPPTAHIFQDTDATHAHVSPLQEIGMLRDELAQLRGDGWQPRAERDAAGQESRRPGHGAAQGFLDKIGEAIERSGVPLGDDPVAGRARLSASLLAEALKKGFNDSDELVIGQNRAAGTLAEGQRIDMFRRNGSVDPVENVVSVVRERALSTPVEESYREADALLRNRDAEAQQKAGQQQVEQPGMRL